MEAPLVVFDGVWKKFRRGERHDSLRDLIPAAGRKLFGGRRADDLREREFWALQDVSFELGRGDALGIIGPNGSGKSTTLKLLTRILKPTRGRCAITGRMGALIEIAAGFHPDLTGRENIFLQGAIMGMKRAEISSRFDEIVEFSGVADFIETPVKRYSSGMNARLGFAIAAHLNADVLLIDEVLSVGDFSFQQRAFDRLREVVASGTPTIVVSHQLDRVASLCTEAILLRGGRVAHRGTPAGCIAAYAAAQFPDGGSGGECPIALEAVDIEPSGAVAPGDRVRMTVTGRWQHPVLDPSLSVTIRVRSVQTGQLIFATGTRSEGVDLGGGGPFALEADLQMNVAPGGYMIETVVGDVRASKELAHGPVGYVRVSEDNRFWGSVQMNAHLRLLAPGGSGDCGPAAVRTEGSAD